MLNYLSDGIELTTCAKTRTPMAGLAWTARIAAGAVALLTAVGCQTALAQNAPVPPAATTASTSHVGDQSTNANKSLVLQEGDTIKVSFPGEPSLDTTQTIRRDGKITLELIGEYDAAGKTPSAMETELKNLYGSQLMNNEVTVSVQSSAFVIFITGAIGRPGKLISEKPLTPLQALIESGIDETRSNLKSIWVIRTDEAGHTEHFKINLYNVLRKKDAQMPTFALKPYDIIRVPERFSFY